MKYPFFSNWISYRKISRDKYYVKNYILGTECVADSAVLAFAEKLDGKTDPYTIYLGMTTEETDELLVDLEEAGMIRNDHGIISDDHEYIRTLVITKNTKLKKLISKILNLLLLVAFIPLFILGIYVFQHVDSIGPGRLTALDMFIYRHTWFCYLIFLLSSVVISSGFHELCHNIACRAYGGRVFEYGVAFDPFLSFYTLMDDSNVKSLFKKIQIRAAGMEGNLLLAGIFFLLTSLFPHLKYLIYSGAYFNIVLVFFNLLAIKNSDGMRILLLLTGMDFDDLSKIRHTIETRKTQDIPVCRSMNDLIEFSVYYVLLAMQIIDPLLTLIAAILCVKMIL